MLKSITLKTVVIKVGTKVLAGKGYRLDAARVERIVDQIRVCAKRGIRVVIVSSGAIGSGMGLLGLKKRPGPLAELQACAAIGQPHLMQVYSDLFNKHGMLAAQVLLTQEDLDDRTRYLNARHTIAALLDRGVIPVINENDTVSTEEIKFGDNDKLSSLVANLIEADLLILLSDVDGLYEAVGEATTKDKRVVARIEEISSKIEFLAQQSTDELGRGGMSSKLQAAKIAVNSGIPCIIANGTKDRVVVDIIDGKETGTLFLPAPQKLAARKRWLSFGVKPKGSIRVDRGAAEALAKKNKSLLSSGITGTSGDFKRGDVVSITDENGREFARGISNYSSQEIYAIQGVKTAEIRRILGDAVKDEVVHRDNLVILR